MRLALLTIFAAGVLTVVFAVGMRKEAVAPPPPATPASLIEEKPEIKTETLNPDLNTGEVLIVKFSEEPKNVFFDGKTVTAFPYRNDWRTVVPLSLSAKTGNHNLKAEFANGTTTETAISVSAKKQVVIVLPPPPKLGLTDKQIVQNLATTNTDIREIVAAVENITRFGEPFGQPLSDVSKISSPFGEVRQTGEESIIHLGTDFDVPKGTDVFAVNGGVVEEASFSTIYGNTVIIDHGRGIYSLYMHLGQMKVKAGDSVKKGAVVGTVGDTGLASAPHLHLSIKINGVSVDPIQFVSAFR